MYKKISVLAISIMFTCIIGCDDNSTNTIGKIIGNNNDPSLEFINEHFNSFVFENNILEIYNTLSENIIDTSSGISKPYNLTLSAHDSITFFQMQIDSVSKWIIIEATLFEYEDSINVVDSIHFYITEDEFIIPANPSDFDDINGVEIHSKVTVNIDDSTDFVGSIISSADLHLEIAIKDSIAGNTVQINMTKLDSISGTIFDSTTTCDINTTIITKIENLFIIEEHVEVTNSKSSFVLHGDCPLAGKVSLSINLDLECTGNDEIFNVDDTWSISAVFNAGTTVQLVIENTTTRWSKEVLCE